VLKSRLIEKLVTIDNSFTALSPNILVILGGAPRRYCGLTRVWVTQLEVHPWGTRSQKCKPMSAIYVQLYICYITCFIGYYENSTLNYTRVLWAYGYEVFQYDKIFYSKKDERISIIFIKKITF